MYQDNKPNVYEEIERLIDEYFQKKNMTVENRIDHFDFIKSWLKRTSAKLPFDFETDRYLLEVHKKTT